MFWGRSKEIIYSENRAERFPEVVLNWNVKNGLESPLKHRIKLKSIISSVKKKVED